MKKIILILFLIIITNKSSGELKRHEELGVREKIITSIGFKGDEVLFEIFKIKDKASSYHVFNKTKFETKEISKIEYENIKKEFLLKTEPFSPKIQVNDKFVEGDGVKILFNVSKCREIDMLSPCNELTFRYDIKLIKAELKESNFFQGDGLQNLVKWKDFFVMVKVSQRQESVDSNVTYLPIPQGFLVLDLKSKKILEKLNSEKTGVFEGTWVNLIYSDPDGKLIWLGTDQGLFAFDENFNEVISCVVSPQKYKEVESIIGKSKCYKTKFENDTKDLQASFLFREDPELKEYFKKMDEADKKKKEKNDFKD